MKKFLLALTGALLLTGCQTDVDLDDEIIDGEDDAVCWMSNLPDSTPLAALSIPGAHDAATASITSLKMFTQTQDLSIAELFNCGVRAFDLRPAYVDDQMGIYHDKYSTHTLFYEVLDCLMLALERHPGECALIVIRHEEEADDNTPKWGAVMGTYLKSIRTNLASWHPGMTLGEMRGKILVLSRNRYDGGPWGAYIDNWTSSRDINAQKSALLVDESGATSPLWVQDYYDPEGAEDKWEEVSEMFEATAAAAGLDPAERPLVINHTSGYIGSLPNYRGNAVNINAKAAEYISSSGTPAGIVVMDFAGVATSKGKKVAGDQLVRAIIENN